MTINHFFLLHPASTAIYFLSLHDSLPILVRIRRRAVSAARGAGTPRRSSTAAASGRSSAVAARRRSEEHTSELQSLRHLVCRLLLEKKKNTQRNSKTEETDYS